MKVLLFGLALVACVFASDLSAYPTKYDSLDIDAILSNKRLFDTYVNCLLNKGKCSEEGSILKEIIPDALITGCKKCNEHQRASVEKVCRFLYRNRNADWVSLINLYDPKGIYQSEYASYTSKF